jgi:hypothetical protein
MYRLVTWRMPPNYVTGTESLKLGSQIREKPAKPIEECNPNAPPEFCQLIHRCMEFKSDRRPERMIDVQEILESLTKTLVQSPEDRLEALEW